ncbi:EcsC family protein [Paenibacillus validus]|uniref:EcsC family protein n=3 Tax=Paenibacillus validus TaxID=44253 RepID=UPI0013DFB7B4
MTTDPIQPYPHTPESREALIAMLNDIATWEKSQKDLWFWEKIGRLPFQLLDRLTPQAIQKKLAQAMDEVGSYVQSGGRYLVSESGVLSRLQEELAASDEARGEAKEAPLTLADVPGLPLAVMNRAAASLTHNRIKLATAQGATTGFGGLFTLAIDIPAILGLSLKTIQEVAMVYGYDPKEKPERVFVIKCLQFASADIVGKKAVLEELADYGNESRKPESLSQLQGWREVVAAYRDNFGWKKLFQLVPIAGMLFGAVLNRSTLQDVAEAATMLYRKRRILERLRQQQ